MHRSILFTLSMAPMFAFAASDCAHTQTSSLNLDLTNVKWVVFEVGAHELELQASKGAAASVRGKACASSERLLPGLALVQERKGDKLIIRPRDKGGVSVTAFGKRYAHLKMTATLPDDVKVQLMVGSGNATAFGTLALSADIGSGRVRAGNTRGTLFADIGSGALDAQDIGRLHVVSVGSGRLNVRNVRDAVQIGKVGSGSVDVQSIGELSVSSLSSGDLSAHSVLGMVRIDEVGSGSVDVEETEGPVSIDTLGSGNVGLRDIGGDVSVGSIGSGNVHVSVVRGDLSVSTVSSGSVRHRNVSGSVRVPEDD